MNRTEPKLILTPSMRMLLFICTTVLCFFLVSIIAYIIMSKAGSSTAAMRILAVVQSVLLFIVPAIAVALMVTRTPARLLEVDNAPGLGPVMLTVLIMVAAIPALNCIIAWNQSWTLPESMHGLEEGLRASEETAASSVRLIMGGTSVMDLIMSILIVGVMAGFSEELFFRGGLQRLFTTSPCRNMDCCNGIQPVPFSVFWTCPTYTTWGLFRVFIVVESEHMASSDRACV